MGQLIRLYILLSFLVITSCSYFRVNESKSEYKFYPTWVSDTLLSKNPGFRKVNLFTPVIFKNTIIVANAIDGLVSYNKDTKNIQWRLPIKFGVEASGVTGQAEAISTLYFGSLNGSFYAVDMNTGAIIWTYETKAEIVAEPLLHNNTLYFINGANALYSLNAKTGQLNWIYNRQETTTKMTVRGGSRPSFADGLIYAGFSDGALVSVNATTGTVQWETQLNSNLRFKDIDSSPVVDGDNIYVNSYDDKLYCLSKKAGSVIWKSPYGGSTAPLVVGDKLFYSSSNGNFYSLSKKDGALLWQKESLGLASAPISMKGLIIYGESEGALMAVDLLTGKEVTRFTPGRGIMSKVASEESKYLYFVSGESNFYQIELRAQSQSAFPYLVH